MGLFLTMASSIGFVSPSGIMRTNMLGLQIRRERNDTGRNCTRTKARSARCRPRGHAAMRANDVRHEERKEESVSQSEADKIRYPGDGSGQEQLQMTASRSESIIRDEMDNDPILHIVFVHPQIHWNTGNIGRTCLGLGARLHLIEPMGFSLDERQVRRAGLDYWEHVDVRVYRNWTEFATETLPGLGGKGSRFFFSKFGTVCAAQVDWPCEGKIVLIFGSEVDGFDGIRTWLNTEGRHETTVAFPMVDDRFRSFNLSTSASMALWDAYKSVRARRRPCVDIESGV